MSVIKTKNLCLSCPWYKDKKCVKQPTDYCMITRSK